MLPTGTVGLQSYVPIGNMSNIIKECSMEIAEKKPRKHESSVLTQERILAAIDDLFYFQGSRAVGVDAVAKHAGTNKMALYRQFSSKDALLMEYLKHREAAYWQRFNESLAKHPDNPVNQLQQIFEDFAIRASTEGYRGCPFVNIAIEYPDTEHQARQAVVRNKQQLHAKLKALATQANVNNPDGLANSLALLFEGACAASQTYDREMGLMQALPTVSKTMIDSHLK